MRTLAEIDADIQKLKDERDSVIQKHRNSNITAYKGQLDNRWICIYDTVPMRNPELLQPIYDNVTIYHLADVVDYDANFKEVVCHVQAKIRIALGKLDGMEFSVQCLSLRDFRVYLPDIQRGLLVFIEPADVLSYLNKIKGSFNDNCELVESLVRT